MRDITVLFDDNGVFSDLSDDARVFTKDQIALNLVALEDAIYIGFYKPFYSFYLDIQDVLPATNGLTAEFSNGAGFSALDVTDDSKALSRSGFMQWPRSTFDNWLEQAVDGTTLFWIKLTFTTDFTANLNGLNRVFADDEDLRGIQRDIDNYMYSQDNSFISYHVAARDEIVQSLRNSGYTTKLCSESPNDLSHWDIIDIEQIRTAAKYLALANIMFDNSANETDKYYQKWRDYKAQYGSSFKLYLLWLDKDDDGKLDDTEQRFFRTVQLRKV